MLVLYSVIWILICIVLQVLVFNHLDLLGGVTFVYLIALLKMPFQVNRSLQILIGFIAGVLVDIFSNTLGLHAIVCTMIMWIRLPLLHMFILAEEVKTGELSVGKLGVSIFVRYMITIVSLYSILFYLIQSFTFFNFFPLLLKIVMSVALTVIFSIVFESAAGRPSK